MTSPDISISPEAIRQHASHIAAFTNDFGLAVSAANSVAMDDDAYGVICSFLPKLFINSLEDQAIAGVKACDDLVSGAASALELVADMIEETEANTANQFSGE